MFGLRNLTSNLVFIMDTIYNNKLSINENNLDDIKNIMKFILEEYKGF